MLFLLLRLIVFVIVFLLLFKGRDFSSIICIYFVAVVSFNPGSYILTLPSSALPLHLTISTEIILAGGLILNRRIYAAQPVRSSH